MTATAEEPERLGMCRVCYQGVTSEQPHTRDWVSGWYFHAECQLPESEKRGDVE